MMTYTRRHPRLTATTLFGLLLWLALSYYSYITRIEGLGIIELAFLFFPTVLMPLVLAVTSRDRLPEPQKTWEIRLLGISPFTMIGVCLAFALPQGFWAAAFTIPWLTLSFAIACGAVTRLSITTRNQPLVSSIGRLYLPVGGVWLVLSRYGAHPLGFEDPIGLLTAMHFHYAGFALPVLIGELGKDITTTKSPRLQSLYRLSSGAVLAGIPLLAIGIIFSRPLEFAAAVLLASAVSIYALLCLFVSVPRHRQNKIAAGFIAIASLSALITMALAITYAYGRAYSLSFLDIPSMVFTHGALNALGLTLCGLLGRLRLSTEAAAEHVPPFSKLMGFGRIGADFFHRKNLIDRQCHATGLTDDLASYSRADFDVSLLPSLLRRFYEHTKDFDLIVRPHWSRGFRGAGKTYRLLAEVLGQMCFPVDTQETSEAICSEIFALKDAPDGRAKVRAWVRTYIKTGCPIYVAAYSSHRRDTETYMNIAFPLWGGNLTSLLRLELRDGPARDHCSLVLTTRSRPRQFGDEGIYLVTPLFILKLPMSETIHVATQDEQRLVARHEIWFCGLKFLTLDYEMRVLGT